MRFLRGLVLGLLGVGAARAQEPRPPDQTAVDEVVIVGSRLQGAAIAATSTAKVMTADRIEATGAVSGDDLLRALPQMGDVFIHANNNVQTSNSARGDINSINLRGLGVGYTLVLINGRRTVTHPTSQSSGTVPLLGYNANALPATGLSRLEVLPDGASAIYGADAVAGVVNAVMPSRHDGIAMNLRHGWAEGTHRHETGADILAGAETGDGRGHVVLVLDVTDRTAQRSSDEPYTRTLDLRSLFSDKPAYAASNAPDARGALSSFATIGVLGVDGAVRRNGVAITTAAGAAHVQPDALAGCAASLGSGLCLGVGGLTSSGAANSLRYDGPALDQTTATPAIRRLNLFLAGGYRVADLVEAYGELEVYAAASRATTLQGSSLVAIGVPASNGYNPFGPVVFADGRVNPNRLPGLTNVPAEGAAVTISGYRFNDLGPNIVKVDNSQVRALIGLKGGRGRFAWDSGLLYSRAAALDRSDAIDSAKLAAQLALSTPDAYNPFNGGCLSGPQGRDCTPSNQAALDAIRIRIKRRSASGLLLADFKLSTSDLLALPAGSVDFAAGVEARRETQSDRRDPRLDGGMPFTDPVTGLVSASNVTGTNDTPSTRGAREVVSAYAELAAPVVSPDFGIPFARRIDLHLAGRVERYSDFGAVATPKAALAWEPVAGVRLRAAWQKGFRAPNLETTNPFSYSRSNAIVDDYLCEADLRAGRIKTFSACARAVNVRFTTSGNPDLKAEHSESRTLGVVFTPSFLPARFGELTFSADRWRIDQKGVVGLLGSSNLAIADYLARVGGGADAAVLRASPTRDDVALFAGTGLAPVGPILEIKDQFRMLQAQALSGVDVSLSWRSPERSWGALTLDVDAVRMDRFSQALSEPVKALFDARAAGVINPATPLSDPGDLLRKNGKPKWKAGGQLTWVRGDYRVGASAAYTGSVLDTALLASDGTPYVVKAQLVAGAYVDYRPGGGRTHLRLGARNLFDRDPPLASAGYLGALYNPYGRYWYLNLGRSF